MPEAGNRCGYVAIVGRPNVGKSTLLNRMLGQKLVITSHKAQTTRHSILGVKTRTGGQLVFMDTPGIHRRGNDALNRYLNRTARTSVGQVDLVLFVVEGLRWTSEDEEVLEVLRSHASAAIAVVNKVDRIREKQRLLPFLQELSGRYDFLAVVPVSAISGDQVEVLEQQVLSALPQRENIFPEDQLSDRPERFFAAELLREQLTGRYGDELPYQLSVEIERFREQAGRYLIQALIWVERPAQKAILIGKKGEALKAAATRARLEMQKFFGCSVHLEVWVKVKKSWSSDEAAIARLGYSDS